MLHNPKREKKERERDIYHQLILLFLQLMIFKKIVNQPKNHFGGQFMTKKKKK